jgi:hypothetical protein
MRTCDAYYEPAAVQRICCGIIPELGYQQVVINQEPLAVSHWDEALMAFDAPIGPLYHAFPSDESTGDRGWVNLIPAHNNAVRQVHWCLVQKQRIFEARLGLVTEERPTQAFCDGGAYEYQVGANTRLDFLLSQKLAALYGISKVFPAYCSQCCDIIWMRLELIGVQSMN